MKKTIFKIIILLFTISSCPAQLTGRTTLEGNVGLYMISVNGTYIENYGDNFSIELTEKLNKIFFSESWISIEIINVPKGVKCNLGDLEIPMRKSITVEEYNKLDKDEKQLCIPVHHYLSLLGYEYLDRLQNSKIIFICSNSKFELEKFEFDVKEQKVIIDWKELKPCPN